VPGATVAEVGSVVGGDVPVVMGVVSDGEVVVAVAVAVVVGVVVGAVVGAVVGMAAGRSVVAPGTVEVLSAVALSAVVLSAATLSAVTEDSAVFVVRWSPGV
jgi:hypothetical protein